ncbi:putative short-chain dehydrogenase [Daldinia bambusicola]|nr:putative short-chain dehydrogenase [Daldinia bambusicola]
MAYQRSIIITGGTINLGYYTALQIAKEHPEYLVVVSSRTDREHAADTINKTLSQKNVVYIPLDLSSSQNVRGFAENWTSKDYPPIQALVFNAALQFPNSKVVKTVDGIEATFGINHVGHALLFHLLCPYLAQNARIVVVSSPTHDPDQVTGGMPKPKFISTEEMARPTSASANNPGLQRYTESKLVNIMWTYALDHRLKQRVPERGITVNAFDPGLMPGSGLTREYPRILQFIWNHILPRMIPFLRIVFTPDIHTPEDSAKSLTRLAVGADVEGDSGKYFEATKPINSSKESYEEAKQDDVWQWTVNYLAKDEQERERFESLK